MAYDGAAGSDTGGTGDAGAGSGTAVDALLGTNGGGNDGKDSTGATTGNDDPGGQQAGGDVTGGADPEWYANLSAESADADNPSNRDWAKAAGVKDIDGLVKIARDNQKALRDSGRVKVPGADAKPEDVAAFHKAIGVPDDAKGYSIVAPKDAAGHDIPLNDALIGKLAESAHKAGMPKAAFESVVGDFVKMQLDEAADIDARGKSEAEAVVKAWGADGATKLSDVNRAAEALGIDRDKLVAMRNVLGAKFTLETLAKLGGGMAEDVLITGGKGRFGVSGAEAKAEMDKLKGDAEFQKKVMIKGSPERVRWDRLQDAVAAYEAKKAGEQ